MMVPPLKDQYKIIEIIEFIISNKRNETSIDDIMQKFKLTYAEYSMIENIALPAFKQANEAESFRSRYGSLKARLHSTKEKWAIETLREEEELIRGNKK